MSEQATAAAEQTQMAMPKHGQICWTEIATSDIHACKSFYTELFGWSLKKSETTGIDMEYYEFATSGEGCPSGGMYQIGKECGDAMTSRWMSYVTVDDVDAAAAKVWELGGKVCVPPTDIPNVGRFSVVTDPTGAAFSMIKMNPWDGANNK